MREYQNSKSKIIAAAISILAEKGPGHLPVEDIAARADISKGGFFYNFKTKEDLLNAIVETLQKDLMAQVDERIERDENPRGRYLRSFLRTFLENELSGDVRHRAILACFVEIFTSFPTLKSTFKPLYEFILDHVSDDELPNEVKLLVTSAMDGIFLTFMLGADATVRETRMTLVRHMIELTEKA